MAPPRPPAVDLRIVPSTPEWQEHERFFRARKPVADHVEVFDLENHTLYPYMIAVADNGRIARHTVRKGKLLRSIPSLSNASLEDRREAWRRSVAEVDPRPETPTVDEPCVLLGSGQPTNYFHWLVEFVAKLDLISEVQNGRRLVIPRPRFPFNCDSLRYFGIEPRDCIVAARPTRFRDLRTTSSIALSNTRLSSFVGAFFEPRSGYGGRRIYISRREARSRRVVNEDALLDLLTKAGFEEVCPGELPFAEQVATFRGASIVVGAHGAGLANTAFMPAGSKVIELLPDNNFTRGVTCYAALSEQRMFRHVILLCPSTGARGETDITVPRLACPDEGR